MTARSDHRRRERGWIYLGHMIASVAFVLLGVSDVLIGVLDDNTARLALGVAFLAYGRTHMLSLDLWDMRRRAQ